MDYGCVYSEVMSSNHHKTVRTSLLLHSFLTSQLLYFPKIIVIVDVLGRIPSCCWLGFRMLIDCHALKKLAPMHSVSSVATNGPILSIL